MRLTRVTILVRDQDEALQWFTQKLGFRKMVDQPLGLGVRWLTVAPEDQKELEIVLLKPDAAVHGKKLAQELTKRIGKGTTWVLEVDDCQKVYKESVTRRRVQRSTQAETLWSRGTFRRSVWEPVGPNTAEVGIIT